MCHNSQRILGSNHCAKGSPFHTDQSIQQKSFNNRLIVFKAERDATVISDYIMESIVSCSELGKKTILLNKDYAIEQPS